MLKLKIAACEIFDNKTQTFINAPEQDICIEHSLISIYRWEAKWKKPYFSKNTKTKKETLDYICCMSVAKDIPMDVALRLTNVQITEILQYVDDSMTATTFSQDNTPPSRQIMTAELIYWQMINYQIPFECQKWHINQLLTLIRVCGLKSQSPKKMGKKELADRNRQLNKKRREEQNSRG